MGHDGNRLTVFYDGACVVCSREMDQYRRRDKNGQLTLIDIAAASFDPSLYDRDLKVFMAQLHVRDASGAFYTGVDGFAKIWEVMPQPEYHLLAAVVALPGISLLARGGYWLFARTRRFLPKIAGDCDDGSCSIGHRH